ncbi:hypothetical protein CQ055_11040 [Brucella pseudogrignonensis]|nr:hypothetical protein CQ063_11155 [Brucella pseudogrignonensis]PRA69884.1 hypothetical protein CQ055_11040 [Brucella pseudogrignonensis]
MTVVMNGFAIAGKLIAFSRGGASGKALSARCALTGHAEDLRDVIGNCLTSCIRQQQAESVRMRDEWRRMKTWLAINSRWKPIDEGRTWAKGSSNCRHRALA